VRTGPQPKRSQNPRSAGVLAAKNDSSSQWGLI
jgi:hypothetical protein